MASALMQTVQFFALIFVCAMAAGYFVTALKLRARRHFLEDIAVDTLVRIKSPCGLYRARFLGWRDGDLEFSAPIKKGCYVPLRVGEELSIEVPLHNKVIVFHAEVKARDPWRKSLILQKPDVPHLVNRREDSRSFRFYGEECTLNDDWAELVDVSLRGGRFLTLARYAAGDVVRILIPKLNVNVLGSIVECAPAAVGERLGCAVRIRFAEAIPPIPVDLK